MSDYCNTCHARSLCESICPELKLHLKNNIEVPEGREKTIGIPRYINKTPWSSSVYLTPQEHQIFTLSAKGMPRKDISQLLNISRETLRKHISNGKKKYVQPSRF